jgi:hypothetical protein|tara:strand:+ start:330 stop:953 length:624 start_codon:yes stop_codon:yes gene_type:complete
MSNKIIGISGVAGSGKDLFFDLLSNFRKCRKISLAKALKEEVAPWTKKHYGIDATNCSREDKEVIRPLLVFHANVKRGCTYGRYWINIVNENIKKLKLDDDEILVITDIRFDHYDQDEVFWLKKELKGSLIHISNYVTVESDDCSPPVIIAHGPANDAEKTNDPKLKLQADYSIDWEFIQRPQDEVEEILTKKHIEPFIRNFLDTST